MHIDNYEFGRIVIDGQAFNGDVLVFGGKISSPWWRIQGHHLTLEDVKELLDSKPKRLIIGTGYSGMMKIDNEVFSYCDANSISLTVKETKLAVDEFNREPGSSAAFHLTC